MVYDGAQYIRWRSANLCDGVVNGELRLLAGGHVLEGDRAVGGLGVAYHGNEWNAEIVLDMV